ncbi:pterocarpan synthase 1-like [Nymphaea colorata]|nr:pterocarpan synthase 1-like [Nymphaea colorata]
MKVVDGQDQQWCPDTGASAHITLGANASSFEDAIESSHADPMPHSRSDPQSPSTINSHSMFTSAKYGTVKPNPKYFTALTVPLESKIVKEAFKHLGWKSLSNQIFHQVFSCFLSISLSLFSSMFILGDLTTGLTGSNYFFLSFLAILLTVSCAAKTSNHRIIPSPAIRLQKQRTTHIHFFFHDIVTGRNPTVATIVQSPLNNLATGFGEVNMIDDPLTEGRELTSKLIGRAQGFYASAALQNVSLLMVQTYVFLEGAYNGSTLSVLGRNSASVPIRELAVVGGTGYFRMAQGYTQARIHRLNATTGDAVVEYDVYVRHYPYSI